MSIHVTEKIHGANARFTFAKNADGEEAQFCGDVVAPAPGVGLVAVCDRHERFLRSREKKS